MPKPLSVSERAAVVDEIGALDAATRPVADKIKRLAALKKQAQAWPEEDKCVAGEPVLYAGREFFLTLGARENKRTVDVAALFKLLGRIPFLLIASVKLEDVDRVVDESKKHTVVSEARTGSRSVTVAQLRADWLPKSKS